jgi:hypothetical protein
MLLWNPEPHLLVDVETARDVSTSARPKHSREFHSILQSLGTHGSRPVSAKNILIEERNCSVKDSAGYVSMSARMEPSNRQFMYDGIAATGYCADQEIERGDRQPTQRFSSRILPRNG